MNLTETELKKRNIYYKQKTSKNAMHIGSHSPPPNLQLLLVLNSLYTCDLNLSPKNFLQISSGSVISIYCGRK